MVLNQQLKIKETILIFFNFTQCSTSCSPWNCSEILLFATKFPRIYYTGGGLLGLIPSWSSEKMIIHQKSVSSLDKILDSILYFKFMFDFLVHIQTGSQGLLPSWYTHPLKGTTLGYIFSTPSNFITLLIGFFFNPKYTFSYKVKKFPKNKPEQTIKMNFYVQLKQ